MIADEKLWITLEYLGTMELESETIDGVTYPAEKVEQRNCTCGSTLGRDVPTTEQVARGEH